jgi:Cys-tRNA(Pro)/Cys-tRNA(Cys) deacylase
MARENDTPDAAGLRHPAPAAAPAPAEAAEAAQAARPPETPATLAVAAAGLEHELRSHGRVGSLEEAAAALGVEPREIVKTLVVRRNEGEHLLVLVPGDRRFSWPKLRALLGENRLTMPDAAGAKAVTGYERGTITPFGTTTPLPLILDASLVGRRVSLGAGRHGLALIVNADDVAAHLNGTFADVSED